MAKKEKKTHILPFGKALIYGIGILGIQMLIGMLNSYQSQFYTSVFHADLMKCAIIILVAKIISSFADPIIGSVIDRSNLKGGKMRPWVGISIIPFAILTTLMFVNIPFKNDVLMYGYITITSVLWSIAMSFCDIPSQGMLALLTPDSDEKSTAAGISNIGKSIGVAAPTVVVPIVCMLTKSATITSKEYLLTAAIISVLAILIVALMLKTSKEVIASPPQEDTSIKAMFTELRHNKMLLLTFLVYILGFGRNIAMNISVQASAAFMHEVSISILGFKIDLAGENLSVLMGIGCGVLSMISMAIAPVINNKLGTKKTYLLFGIYGFITSTASFLLYAYGGETFRSMPAVIIMYAIVGLMFGTHGYTPMVMLADTVDYTEMKTGRRNEGVQYAVLSLAVKLANALSVATGVFMVGASGYNGTMSYAEIVATPGCQNTIAAAFFLVPGICVALSCIPVCFYKIDGKVKEELKEFMSKKELKNQ